MLLEECHTLTHSSQHNLRMVKIYWKLQNQERETLNMMWDPQLFVIFNKFQLIKQCIPSISHVTIPRYSMSFLLKILAIWEWMKTEESSCILPQHCSSYKVSRDLSFATHLYHCMPSYFKSFYIITPLRQMSFTMFNSTFYLGSGRAWKLVTRRS